MKALWTNEETDKEVKMTYECITFLRYHLETVGWLACENLAIRHTRQAEYYDQKTKPPQLKVNDRMLLLLLEVHNKLQMLWSGPLIPLKK